jgi:hypothetical protein
MNLNNIATVVQDEIETILTDILGNDNINDLFERYQYISRDISNNSNYLSDTNSNRIFTPIVNNRPNNSDPAENRRPNPTINVPTNNSTHIPQNNVRQQRDNNYVDLNEIYDTLYHLNMNMHEYNMNYRDYQRNVENVLNIITEQNRRNYFPRRNYTNANTFDVGHNISYFLYNPARRANANRMNTSTPLGMGLSPDMIRLSTRIVPFTSNFSDTRCPITLEDFTINEKRYTNYSLWTYFQNRCSSKLVFT